MRRFSLLVAALHASALAMSVDVPSGRAQEAAEVQAYMRAVAVGTPEAMTAFLAKFPYSILPGSDLGASIAATIEAPPARPAAAAPVRVASSRRAAPQTGIY